MGVISKCYQNIQLTGGLVNTWCYINLAEAMLSDKTKIPMSSSINLFMSNKVNFLNICCPICPMFESNSFYHGA